MAVATVNISFQEDLIERKKKWESIFAYGESLSSKYKFTEDDVNKEIQKDILKMAAGIKRTTNI
jgi:hypothetical protein